MLNIDKILSNATAGGFRQVKFTLNPSQEINLSNIFPQDKSGYYIFWNSVKPEETYFRLFYNSNDQEFSIVESSDNVELINRTNSIRIFISSTNIKIRNNFSNSIEFIAIRGADATN